MAKKQTVRTGTDGENLEETNGGTTEETNGGTTEETNGGTTEETGGEGEAAEIIQLIFIGPSIPYEKLHSSQILQGTEAEIEEFMAPIFEKYPEARELLATPENLPEALKKVESNTSILHKYYQDMLARSREPRR